MQLIHSSHQKREPESFCKRSAKKFVRVALEKSMTDMEVAPSEAGPSGEASGSVAKKGKRFEIKKWNAVALWAWGRCLSRPKIQRVISKAEVIYPMAGRLWCTEASLISFLVQIISSGTASCQS